MVSITSVSQASHNLILTPIRPELCRGRVLGKAAPSTESLDRILQNAVSEIHFGPQRALLQEAGDPGRGGASHCPGAGEEVQLCLGWVVQGAAPPRHGPLPSTPHPSDLAQPSTQPRAHSSLQAGSCFMHPTSHGLHTCREFRALCYPPQIRPFFPFMICLREVLAPRSYALPKFLLKVFHFSHLNLSSI